MLCPRIIPFLLVHEGGLVKTVGFKDPKYVGDPINAVKIFNEKEADELCVVRSVHSETFNHGPAISFMTTGDVRYGRPTMGAWLSRTRISRRVIPL